MDEKGWFVGQNTPPPRLRQTVAASPPFIGGDSAAREWRPMPEIIFSP
jgi:hypothetical protein